MTPATPFSPICPVCRSSGGACPHCTDLNRAVPKFDEPGSAAVNELHEFQFFRHDDNTVDWMFKDTFGGGSGQQGGEMQPQLAAPEFRFLDSLSEAFDVIPGHGLSFEFRPEPAAPPAAAEEGMMTAVHAASSAHTISAFPVDGSSEEMIACHAYSGDISGQLYDAAAGLDREAKVRRYKEKRQKRKYKKQIRYASRKAYAEMRPRINGRFAKIHEKTSSSLQQPAPDDPRPPPFDPDAAAFGFRWFR